MQGKTVDFRAAILELVEGNVRFVLIGGLAMIARGASHITFDVDVSYERNTENLIALVKVLKNCHARLRNVPADLPFLLNVKTFKNVQNLTLTTDVGDLDLLAEPAGVDSFKDLWDRATEIEIFGFMVRVASLEDLIAMKRAAGRPKDQQHLLELLDLQQFLRDEARREGPQSG